MAKKARYFKYTHVKAGPIKRIKMPPGKTVGMRKKAIRTEFVRPRPSFPIHRRSQAEKLDKDPYEKYAVPEWQVRGFQSERIVYKMALTHRHVPGADFTFQSSQQGGRTELGGMVADFLWPRKMLILQVQGPTHEENLRMRKDSEQADMMTNLGYTIVYIDLNTVHNQAKLDDFFTRYIDINPTAGGSIHYGASPEGLERATWLAQGILDTLRSM